MPVNAVIPEIEEMTFPDVEIEAELLPSIQTNTLLLTCVGLEIVADGVGDGVGVSDGVGVGDGVGVATATVVIELDITPLDVPVALVAFTVNV